VKIQLSTLINTTLNRRLEASAVFLRGKTHQWPLDRTQEENDREETIFLIREKENPEVQGYFV
jgi:hypothetical protein